MSSALRPAARFAAATRARVHITRAPICVRYQSESKGSKGSNGSRTPWVPLVIAGAIGGGAVFCAAFGYYHFSGLKDTVDKVQSIGGFFKKRPQSSSGVTSKSKKDISTEDILNFLRSVSNSYADTAPGATFLVDLCFDAIDELHDTHQEEVDRVLRKAYDDLTAIIAEESRRSVLGIENLNAEKLLYTLSHVFVELGNIVQRTGGDAFTKLRERYTTDAVHQWGDILRALEHVLLWHTELTVRALKLLLESYNVVARGKLPPETPFGQAKAFILSKVREVKNAFSSKENAQEEEELRPNPEHEKLLVSTKVFVPAEKVFNKLMECTEILEPLNGKLKTLRETMDLRGGSQEERLQSISVDDEKEFLQAMEKLWQILAEARDELYKIQKDKAAIVKRLRQRQRGENEMDNTSPEIESSDNKATEDPSIVSVNLPDNTQ